MFLMFRRCSGTGKKVHIKKVERDERRTNRTEALRKIEKSILLFIRVLTWGRKLGSMLAKRGESKRSGGRGESHRWGDITR